MRSMRNCMQNENVTCLIQESAMAGAGERSVFWKRFAKDNEKTLVGFCIMGGISRRN